MNEFINKQLNKYYSKKEVSDILEGLSFHKRTTFRINRLKTNVSKMEEILRGLSISFIKNEDYPDAFILDNYSFEEKMDTKTGLKLENFHFYKNGEIYMQSLSSMKPVYVLDPKPKENILDMCAAPGSKTTMIQSITNNKVNLTATELYKDRFERLKYNCDKQGANVLCLNQNACDLNDMFKFDKILLDAPCTGSGTICTTDKNYEEYFNEKLLEKCISSQKKLIKKAAKLLAKGGTLVYSTCSLFNEENEDMLEFAKSVGFSLVETPIKIFPDPDFEGFFIAKFLL